MPTASKQNSAAEYAKNHWRRFESNAEHDERVEAADAEAGRYFDDATKVQKAAYTLAISDLRGLSGPRYERARADARAAWDASTEQARELFYITADEIMRDGEVSEETGALWDALSVAGVEAREAARTARAEFVDRAAAADDDAVELTEGDDGREFVTINGTAVVEIHNAYLKGYVAGLTAKEAA